jgi:hypothetical protein
LRFVSVWTDREVASSSELTRDEVRGLLDHLRAALAEGRVYEPPGEAAGGAS